MHDNPHAAQFRPSFHKSMVLVGDLEHGVLGSTWYGGRSPVAAPSLKAPQD